MEVSDDDWRLQGQEELLAGRALVWRSWKQDRPRWDHDHCEFCWATFSEFDGGEDLKEGWVTADDNYSWVCPGCFEDFRERFRWTVEPGFERPSL